MEVAHIKPLSEGGPDDPENMVALCPNCHKKLDKGDEKARNEVIEALRKNDVGVQVEEKDKRRKENSLKASAANGGLNLKPNGFVINGNSESHFKYSILSSSLGSVLTFGACQYR